MDELDTELGSNGDELDELLLDDLELDELELLGISVSSHGVSKGRRHVRTAHRLGLSSIIPSAPK